MYSVYLKCQIMKKIDLLPHGCQKAGWILAVMAPLFFIVTCVAYNHGYLRFMPSSVNTSVAYILLFTGMFLIAFSREKTEDEMIRGIRAKSVAIAAAIQFVLFIVSSLVYALDHTLHFVSSRLPYLMYTALSNVLFLFLLYVAVFRIKLLINR